jgi:hypothetical protein
MIIPTNYVVGHFSRSADEGIASLGAQVYSGIPIVVELSECVSTSSSSIDGPGASLILNVEGKSVRTFF